MAARSLLCLLALAVALGSPCLTAALFEDFGSKWDSRWIHSSDDKYTGKFVVETPTGLETPALKVPAKAKHYGLTTKLDKEVDPAKGLVLQYELKLSDGLTCGGAYLKYLTATPDFSAADLKDDTAYSIMFGPDKCGSTNKVHFILRHKAPSGEIEEKHLQTPPMVELDKGTHVYTAILNPEDNTYEILIDGEEKKAGSLFEDFQPAINPPEEIDDPEDAKPDTWVDTARIPDPAATKPEDWDEDAPATIPDEDATKPEGWLDDEPSEVDDPEASQPEDWDEEEDGEWEPPRVPNPKCSEGPGCGEWKRPTKPNPAFKGKWSAPLIDNPEYKGPWSPRKIPNPAHFKDSTPLANIGAIGAAAIEIWTMDEGYYFSNILIASDPAEAEAKRDALWKPKKALEDKLKAAEEAEAAEKAKSASLEDEAADGAKTLGGRIAALFDAGPLSAARPTLQPALDFIEDHEWAALALVAALPALAAFLLLPRLLGSKKKATVVRPVAAPVTVTAVKKEDVAVPDDPTAAAEVTAATAADDEAEGEGKIRRRARRET